jgi:hypothetical protein
VAKQMMIIEVVGDLQYDGDNYHFISSLRDDAILTRTMVEILLTKVGDD